MLNEIYISIIIIIIIHISFIVQSINKVFIFLCDVVMWSWPEEGVIIKRRKIKFHKNFHFHKNSKFSFFIKRNNFLYQKCKKFMFKGNGTILTPHILCIVSLINFKDFFSCPLNLPSNN